MRLYTLAVLFGCGLTSEAAVLRGIVLDGQSGRPLSRTRVQLLSIQRVGENAEAARTTESGVFTFTGLKAGAYLLSAAREGFAALEYGQARWNAPGRPLQLEATAELLVEMRMHRLGAISGTVSDENDVGLPEQTVVVYRIGSPPRLVGTGVTDDRGAYRVGELEPGRYVVRNAPKALDEIGGTLPTFFKYGNDPSLAERVVVRLDGETPDVNLRPAMGRLLRLRVNSRNASELTLTSGFGPVPTSMFAAESLAPGPYELLLEGGVGNRWQRRVAGYLKVNLDRDELDVRVPMAGLPQIEARVLGPDGRETESAEVWIRRRDLSGPGATQRVNARRTSLLPGEWEVLVKAPSGTYASSLEVNATPLEPDIWNRISIGPERGYSVQSRLSGKPASLRGTVRGAVGAPVYLERYDIEERRRRGELRSTRTNESGEYQFGNLAPGCWRVLSSFDVLDPDEESMEMGKPKLVRVKEGDAAVQDLELSSLEIAN